MVAPIVVISGVPKKRVKCKSVGAGGAWLDEMSCRIDGFEADFKATEEWLEDTGEDYYSIRIPPEGICPLP